MKNIFNIARLSIGSAIALSVVDLIVKLLVKDGYPIVMLAWDRLGIIAVVLGTLCVSRRSVRGTIPRAPVMQLIRGLAAAVGTIAVFKGLQVIPLGQNISIVFTAPIIANVLSVLLLGERGTSFTWLASLMGGLGVMMISKPMFSIVGFDILYPLLGAFSLAIYLVLTRAVSGKEYPEVSAFWGPFIAFVCLSFFVFQSWKLPQSWQDLVLVLAIGGLAALAQIWQVRAYSIGTTHQVAPFGYISIACGVLLGWLVFGDLPDVPTWAGIVVIVGAGVLLIFNRTPD